MKGEVATPPHQSQSLTEAHRQNSAESYTLKNILTLIGKKQPEYGGARGGQGREGYRDNMERLQYLHHCLKS